MSAAVSPGAAPEPSPAPKLDPREEAPRIPSPPYRRPSLRSAVGILVLFVLFGSLFYPAAITGLAGVVVPHNADGSLIANPNGTWQGSSLVGENITDPHLFWLRPSAADYLPFQGAGDSSSYGPTDPMLRNVTLRYIAEYGLTNVSVPLDLVSASASGLDPDLTPEAVLVQVPRVAFQDNLTQNWTTRFVLAHIETPYAGIFGPQYVNVVELDLALVHALALMGRPLPIPSGELSSLCPSGGEPCTAGS